MNAVRSALYAGKVMHARLRPCRHTLRYSVFYLLLDLDEIDALAGDLRLFSRNRANLFSFNDRDHGDGSSVPLRVQVESHLREAGIEAGGPVHLFCMPRILGYVFNPLSIYFCHRPDSSLAAILYEVSNTFGERHNYLIPVVAGSQDVIHQQSEKSLYVSPFMATEMTYSFAITPPGARLLVSITGSDAEGPLIVAKVAATRRTLTDASLLRAFFAYPLLTLKVIAGIHWEALRLWLKGVRLQQRPLPPDDPVTIGRQTGFPVAPKRRTHAHQ
ncbi:DUF1365 family protein [Rhizobium sp. BK251]|uniref:DUF1365 domain-containing protein n=1 Tax=Rhizobium sp. BK251 TaxID=2512125 RepID=UPI00104D67D2|nr:DUF1365 family protein [Rhizobium sp. BK251]TCL68405.1 hypothetical protein EV286_109334 [Rhizobium sp. BK251]